MEDSQRRLFWHGMFIFLLGLITGFLEEKFVNPRMGLAAHLEGIMNGTFLLALGAAWMQVRLSARSKVIAFRVVLYGTYANWLFTMLAAVFGTAALSPIAGSGHGGKPWQEILITVGFLSVALAMVAATVLVLWGLRRGAAAPA